MGRGLTGLPIRAHRKSSQAQEVFVQFSLLASKLHLAISILFKLVTDLCLKDL